jgi:hypothetical protein
MSVLREPFSWEGDDDLPVPLDSADRESAPPIIKETEILVRDAEEEIAGQDADPMITTSPPGPLESMPRARRRVPHLSQGPSRAALATCLVLACGLGFLHGWNVGAKAVKGGSAASCDSHHCQTDPSNSEWKEEQRL